MNQKTKIISIFIITLVAFTFSVSGVLAGPDPINITDKLQGVGTNAGYTETEPNMAQTIGGIIKIALSVLGVIFMAYTVYAGYLWMTARGEEEKIVKAKAIIRGSIIGLIIVLGAYAITLLVVNNIVGVTKYNPTG